ncbi:ATP-binding protein [Raoultibacter phocaeensis]|uniref:ATP-binding protein n=1 Tax=Raoultibacter phocaeensis TaxID=2479841 RepID=UPI00111A6C80|nr:ATP-binding protein [Raoultibacter phocaeensis]
MDALRYSRPRYEKLLNHYLDTEQVKVLKGIRRCGKSVLLEMLVEELKRRGIEDRNIFYKRFDLFGLPAVQEADALQKEIEAALQLIDEGSAFYVFLDEIQEVVGWERVVRGLHAQPGVDIYITGSNAELFSSELATLLSGRYIELEIYPLSFTEYLHFWEEAGLPARDTESAFRLYLLYGGMPSLFSLKTWDEEDIFRELISIYNTVVLKDVAQRHKIRDLALLERLVKYIFSTSGNLLSTRSVANYLTSSGVKTAYETVDSYLYALVQALILHAAPQGGLQGKELLRPLQKYYPADTGLRNLATNFRLQNIGFQLENVVYMELLRRGYAIEVGTLEKAEIDFVAQRRSERLYIQVSETLGDEKVFERELAPLRAIRDSFPKVVLTMDKLRVGTTEDGILVGSLLEWLQQEEK